MDERFEKVERLRRETGVSYEEARAAFETAGRDLLDALIALEKQGKARRRRRALQHAIAGRAAETGDGAGRERASAATSNDGRSADGQRMAPFAAAALAIRFRMHTEKRKRRPPERERPPLLLVVGALRRRQSQSSSWRISSTEA